MRSVKEENLREKIKGLANGYSHFTLYRDERARDFDQLPIGEEIGGMMRLIPGCYRAKAIGEKTAILAGTEPMDFGIIGEALGRGSFNCHQFVLLPGMKEEELEDQIIEKIVLLFGLEDL